MEYCEVMRAYDVVIGLAVAWARLRGVVFDEEYAVMTYCFQTHASVWHTDREGFFVDRGPVVEPVPLTNTRIAFGIATRRIWLRVPTSGPEMYTFADALLRATEARAQSVREAGARARRRSP